MRFKILEAALKLSKPETKSTHLSFVEKITSKHRLKSDLLKAKQDKSQSPENSSTLSKSKLYISQPKPLQPLIKQGQDRFELLHKTNLALQKKRQTIILVTERVTVKAKTQISLIDQKCQEVCQRIEDLRYQKLRHKEEEAELQQ